MDDQRSVRALGRIEAALERLEAAAACAPAMPASTPDDGLALRHEALRATVAQSLARLDALIAAEDEA